MKERIEIDLNECRKRYYNTNWPLPGATITYRTRGDKLPEVKLEEIGIVEKRRGSQTCEAAGWLKSIKILSIENGFVNYEMTVVTTEPLKPVDD